MKRVFNLFAISAIALIVFEYGFNSGKGAINQSLLIGFNSIKQAYALLASSQYSVLILGAITLLVAFIPKVFSILNYTKDNYVQEFNANSLKFYFYENSGLLNNKTGLQYFLGLIWLVGMGTLLTAIMLLSSNIQIEKFFN